MIIRLYFIAWDNEHASGILPGCFTSYREARKHAVNWKREMVGIEDTPKARKEARMAYSWEIKTLEFDIERVFMCPGHAWYAYITNDLPRSPIVKACPFSNLVPSLRWWASLQPDITALPNCSK